MVGASDVLCPAHAFSLTVLSHDGLTTLNKEISFKYIEKEGDWSP